jgi:hypothetical protein
MKQYVCCGHRNKDFMYQEENYSIVNASDKWDADKTYKKLHPDRYWCIIPYEANEEDLKKYPNIILENHINNSNEFYGFM